MAGRRRATGDAGGGGGESGLGAGQGVTRGPSSNPDCSAAARRRRPRNLPAAAGPSKSRCAVPAPATWPPAERRKYEATSASGPRRGRPRPPSRFITWATPPLRRVPLFSRPRPRGTSVAPPTPRGHAHPKTPAYPAEAASVTG
ncbi:Hypothetical predicted protein [Podarcis lilfordi]|uniref:Uncharacterized protein n=1 Tax=Podarcis lilfordi TaxID=74358 RepID=A0AA35JZM4_9SAUR|nr:Hypothetical predicted protein [Podarcis lilfordi]